ncbi:AtpZ/AtpI family protein [Antrihabitans stalactiti]|uniref:AtpZ/AtpI family protein n=1 Tax=Antrihabitans stalactiti TaxID=2584121 RepID=A0A848KL44_9NOCA|nr:AtpZ/AtpI family protein [Antrihabitans stalactiti]NMN98989.1 AtpZ/AtpI family protein [Antrihabitans stalactiti]
MASEPPSTRQLIGLGATITGSVVAGLVLGFVLDASLHTSPIFVLVGLAVGIVCAAVSMFVQFRAFSKD